MKVVVRTRKGLPDVLEWSVVETLISKADEAAAKVYAISIPENVMKREQRITSMDICREIAPDVYCLEAGKGISRANVYFVRSGSSWVLIDAGLANCGGIIRKTAESLFGANTRPASILLTHDHPDHAGSAVELARMWDCPVYVHPDELPLTAFTDLSEIEPYANPLDRWIILPILRMMPRERVAATLSSSSIKEVVRALDPRTAVPNLPDWVCIPTPGHTPGHVAFFRTSDQVLIAGDAVVSVELNSLWGFLFWGLRLNTQRVSGPPWYSTWDWKMAKESVALLAQREPRVLATGHGVPMSGSEIARELSAFANHFSGPAASHGPGRTR
jgi:glyoxylase-like metal-dependent hydrolase (beta-lactamase superfamily II)